MRLMQNTSDMSKLSRKLFANILRKRFAKTHPEILDRISNDDLLRMHDEHVNAVCERIRDTASKRTDGIVDADSGCGCAQFIEAI
jgi:hypothetical protein